MWEEMGGGKNPGSMLFLIDLVRMAIFFLSGSLAPPKCHVCMHGLSGGYQRHCEVIEISHMFISHAVATDVVFSFFLKLCDLERRGTV